MIIQFPDDINTVEGAVNYVQTSTIEEYAKFKRYILGSDQPKEYLVAVYDAMKIRDEQNV